MSAIVQEPSATTKRQWIPLDPPRAQALVDVRLQVHHAAQLATAAGISYLTPARDDSHTNLEWLTGLDALASRRVDAPASFRIAVQPRQLSVLILDGTDARRSEAALHGRTMTEAAE